MIHQYIDFVRQWKSLVEKSTNGFEIDVRTGDAPFALQTEGPCLRYAEMIVRSVSGGLLLESPDASAPVQLYVSNHSSHMTAFAPHCEDEKAQAEKFKFLVKTALESAFPFRDTLSLHAACVGINGKAVAFTGPSGLGKSTRARAWVENLNAKFISGDRPAIRLEESGAVACGVPWDGKEQIFTTEEKPLLAILEVRRAPFDAMRRLSVEQARLLLMQQCMIPMWDPEAATAAAAVVRRLIDKVPVYRLFCGPGGDSARWAYRMLYDSASQNEFLEPQKDVRLKDGFSLRKMEDRHVAMPVGRRADLCDGQFELNDVAAYLWKALRAPISRDDLLRLLLSEFDVGPTVAESDLGAFLEELEGYELLHAYNA
jgi:hypothetical protein